MFKIIRVKGSSLSPEFQEGDFVVILRRNPFFFKSFREGDVLVFEHPAFGMMIKKLDHFEGERLYVIGTNPHSVDSARFGAIPQESVLGKVLWHIPKGKT